MPDLGPPLVSVDLGQRPTEVSLPQANFGNKKESQGRRSRPFEHYETEISDKGKKIHFMRWGAQFDISRILFCLCPLLVSPKFVEVWISVTSLSSYQMLQLMSLTLGQVWFHVIFPSLLFFYLLIYLSFCLFFFLVLYNYLFFSFNSLSCWRLTKCKVREILPPLNETFMACHSSPCYPS